MFFKTPRTKRIFITTTINLGTAAWREGGREGLKGGWMEEWKMEPQAEVNRADRKRGRGARLIELYCFKWSRIHRWNRGLYQEHNTSLHH